MSEPEKIDIAERVFAGMVKKCRDLREDAQPNHSL
jgi:hypothetical protein